MNEAWFSLLGVGVGTLGAGFLAFVQGNLALAEARRDAHLEQLDQLLGSVAAVDGAVQDWAAYATLYTGSGKDLRHLEEAGRAAGKIAVEGLLATTRAQAIPHRQELSSQVAEMVARARAIKTIQPGSSLDVELAYNKARERVGKSIALAIGEARFRPLRLKSRLRGQFT